MPSSNPPGPCESSSTTKPSPASMEHWTADLVTEHGERVPRHLVAYAVGAAFPIEHLRHIAEALCSPEMLEKNRDNYLAALLFHLIDIGVKQTLLHIHHRGTRKHYILWVHSVSPGLPGEKLTHSPISDEAWGKFQGYLRGKGVNEEVRRSMKICWTQWPKGAAYPVWVPQRLLDVMREQLAMQLPPGELEKAVERASKGKKVGKTRDTRTGGTMGTTETTETTGTTETTLEMTGHPLVIPT